MINLDQLEEKLNELPGKIRDQKNIVIEKERDLENAKLEYDVKYGMALIEAKRPNATEKKADAVIASSFYAEKLIEAKYNLKKAEAGLKYLEDKFIACRKISSLEIEMMKSQLSGV
jgi:hypothetical protein